MYFSILFRLFAMLLKLSETKQKSISTVSGMILDGCFVFKK